MKPHPGSTRVMPVIAPLHPFNTNAESYMDWQVPLCNHAHAIVINSLQILRLFHRLRDASGEGKKSHMIEHPRIDAVHATAGKNTNTKAAAATHELSLLPLPIMPRLQPQATVLVTGTLPIYILTNRLTSSD